jgi:DNA-binding PadR family transcriptional regulator
MLASDGSREENGMHLRYAILALLADGEAHGYRLLKRFNQRLGPFWHPNIGQVYQLLHQLEQRRLVTRRDVTVGTRLRRLFRLTARGERALHTWVARKPAFPPPMRDEIFVRILAVERQGAEALRQQLERQEVEYRRYLALVEEQRREPDDPESLSRQLTHAAARAHTEAHLRWLTDCRALLERDAARLAS